MTIKGKELGVLYVDCGDVVCFSIDAFIHLTKGIKLCVVIQVNWA